MEDTTYASTISNEEPNNDIGFSSPLITFAAVMTFMIMIVGIFGNFLTVAALVKCPKVRNVAAAFIISLCIADLLFCLLVLPFSGMRFINGAWTQVKVLCKLIPFIQYGNIGVSLLCIAMITINRYVMIAHHSIYGKIYKQHWIALMIAFCWLFSYGMQLPTLFGVWGKFDFDPKLQTCSIMNDSHGKSSKTALFIIAFVIPCLIIIACYAKIFWVVHQSEMRMKNHANKQNSIPNNLRGASSANNNSTGQMPIAPSGASESSFSTDTKHDAAQKPVRIKDQREVRAKRNEWRITKMVLAIFLSFVICYLPITIVKVSDKEVDHPELHVISYLLLYLSACINPIIYVIMNKQYRKAYKTVILCEPSKILPFGKTFGGSSAAEKWKDIGLSNNHSRTMVSQMDQINTSLSNSQQQPPMIALELTSKSIARNPTETAVSDNPIKEQNRPMNDCVTIQPTPSLNSPNVMKRIHKQAHLISLVDGDIIVVEEEAEMPTDLPELNQIQQEIPYMNMEAQKKMQYYGQNINVIQDNNEKIQSKPKL